MSSDIISSINK